jgi:hypothetical protein
MQLTNEIDYFIEERTRVITEFWAAYLCQHPDRVGRCELHIQESSATSDFFDPCSVYSAPIETRLIVSIAWDESNKFYEEQLRSQSKEISAQFWERWRFNSIVDLSMVQLIFSLTGKVWVEAKP